jgi:uncharacterized membrane protein (UPF0127 family)
MKLRGGRKQLECRAAKTALQKTRGIMFKGPSFKPLFFEFKSESRGLNAIHSLFCPPFTAVFLDSRKKVLQVIDVEPWHPWITPKKPFKYLVEVPRGKNPFKKGDVLEWV